jgi:hypothetical protein
MAIAWCTCVPDVRCPIRVVARKRADLAVVDDPIVDTRDQAVLKHNTW